MSATFRSRLLTAIVVAAAVLVFYLGFRDNVERSRSACIGRGGEVVLDLDERGVSLIQWCVLPDGTRERI